MSRPYFFFGPGIFEHHRGDEGCRGCRWDRPLPCPCGGLIHLEYADSPDQPFQYRCDVCDRPQSPGLARFGSYDI